VNVCKEIETAQGFVAGFILPAMIRNPNSEAVFPFAFEIPQIVASLFFGAGDGV
jgi:hypothetical protein